jgi:alkylation response protein AidB-like acyl-CoA dehydrogenase
VRTNPEALKQEGISILIVPTDTPGFEIREVKSFLGGHIFHEMFFTDMRVPVADRLGPENAGVSIIRQVIAFERTGSPRFAKAARILDRLAEWAKVNGRDLAEFHQEFALARADCEAARNLAYFVANEQVKGHPPSAWPYASRMATIRAERAVAELAVKVAGEESLIANSLAGAQDLWSLSSGIGGGSYEMSVNSVARQCLGLPKG